MKMIFAKLAGSNLQITLVVLNSIYRIMSLQLGWDTAIFQFGEFGKLGWYRYLRVTEVQ